MSSASTSTREKILQAATELFAAEGSQFSIKELERKSSVSRASIYRHVGDKSQLIKALSRAMGGQPPETDVKAKILEAAEWSFGEYGFKASTMERIAERAGIGVATLFRHFDSKERLVRAFLDARSPRKAVLSFSEIPPSDSESELRALVTMMMNFFRNNRMLLRMVFLGNEEDKSYLDQLRAQSDSSLLMISKFLQERTKKEEPLGRRQAESLALSMMGAVFAHAVIGPLYYGQEIEDLEATCNSIASLHLAALED